MTQVVVILVHRAGQRVLDRHYGARGAALLQRAEHVFETRARQHFDAAAEQFARGLFAERASFALECDPLFAMFHRAPSHRRAFAAGKPIRSRTRSTLWSTISMTLSGRW